jgi:ParB family transcriptional regulator, chromosome partitioning protein
MTTQHPGYSGPRRRGLGRGLDALLGPAPDAAAERPAHPPGDVAALIEVDPALVEPNPEQPRRDFDAAALVALGESIRTHGLLHPIVVEGAGPTYRLVAGERRLRAVRLAGLPLIQAIVRPAAESARQSLETALTENLARADLSPMEEAAAYSRMADAFGMSHEAIALRLGRSRPAISNTIRLLALPAPIQRAVAQGTLSAGHARALLGLSDDERQELMARRAIEQGWSVRQTETAVQAATRRFGADWRPPSGCRWTSNAGAGEAAWSWHSTMTRTSTRSTSSWAARRSDLRACSADRPAERPRQSRLCSADVEVGEE